MSKKLNFPENIEAMEQAATIPAPPREKSAKEIRQEEKERVRRYRMEKKMERVEQKNSLPVRRVGTFTMGIAMVLTGCFILYWLLHPTGNPGFLIYFAPAILIMLGGEVLYNYFFHQGARFKYDILSGIICFILVCGCAGLAVAPVAYAYYGPERHVTESRLQQEIYDICYEKMQNRTDIAGMQVTVDLERLDYDKNMTYQHIEAFDYVGISIDFKNNFRSKEQFAAACQSVTEQINATGVTYHHIRFGTAGEGGYALYLSNDKFSQRVPVDELAERVETMEE